MHGVYQHYIKHKKTYDEVWMVGGLAKKLFVVNITNVLVRLTMLRIEYDLSSVSKCHG